MDIPAIHCNETRTEYHRQLVQACKGEGDIGPFLLYAVRGFLDGLREQYGLICARQQSIGWRDYVYELFHGKEKASDRRQRHLALDLGVQKVPVSVSEIATLTPALALAYA